MVSKGDLGVGYLVGVGFALFAALTSGVVLPGRGVTRLSGAEVLFAALTGLVITAGFSVTGIWLSRSPLSGDRIWRVAQWGTVGLGIPALVIGAITLLDPTLLVGLGWPSVAMINVAGGGVVGLLVGVITELRAQYEHTETLNERNSVFLRLFRHDIRTSVNVILGHLQIHAEESLDPVEEQVEHILRLSNAARQLDQMRSVQATEAVDLATVLRNHIEGLQGSYPEATFETSIPGEAEIRANDLLHSVVDNLLRNAVEHPEDPEVTVSVRPAGTVLRPLVELEVRDNGPGYPEEELDVHAGTDESELKHSDGVGLWLVRWIIESYDGEFEIRNAPEGGAVATVRFRAADWELPRGARDRPPASDGADRPGEHPADRTGN